MKDLITETPKIRRSRNDKRIQIIAYIVTGHGIRETSRDCNVSKNTVRAVIKKNNINYRPGITGYWGHKSNRLRINKPSPVGESKK